MQLALVVREARGWCGRLGTAIGCQHRADAQWHSSEMALRVFACARGRTCGFHAVCVERVMQGAGSAWLGVWECWGARRRVGTGARRAIIFGVLKELLFTASPGSARDTRAFDAFNAGHAHVSCAI